MATLHTCAQCQGSGDNLLRCSVCKLVHYCNPEHQKEHWPKHKHYCVEPFQIGLHISATVGWNRETLTPAFIPLSSGSLTTLNVRGLAKMLQCPEDEVHIMESSFFAGFPQDQRVVLAFSKKPQTYVASANPRYSKVQFLTRSASEPSGLSPGYGNSVLIFYLHPGRDFLVKPDYDAATYVAERWRGERYPTDGEELQRLMQLFASAFEKECNSDQLDPAQPREHFQCIIYPALSEKPFISKQPFIRIESELHQEDGESNAEPGFHVIERIRLLGDTMAGMSDVWGTVRRHHADALRVVMRDNFMNDGSPLNRSIPRAIGRNPHHQWAGNIIVYRMIGESELAMDVEPEDMKAMVEYFKHYPRGM